MKALISPYSCSQEWCEEFFPNHSLCSLPLAGKMAVEYLIDLCAMMGAKVVSVQDYSFDRQCQSRLGNGERWSLELTYSGASHVPFLDELIHRNRSFFEGNRVIIFRGAVMPDVPSLEALWECPRQEYSPGEYPSDDGVYLYEEGRLSRIIAPLFCWGSLRGYFELNFRLVTQPSLYVLPGYSAENSVYTGMNVVIKNGCEIQAPVMLCDNICLERDCQLKNGVILCDGVLVDHGTELDNALVLENTYIGPDMHLQQKIVYGSRIIDPIAEVFVDQDENGIAMDMRKFGLVDFLRWWEWLLSLQMVLLQLLPWLLLQPIKLFGWGRRIYRRLSLDRFTGFLRVLFGRGWLITPNVTFTGKAVLHPSDGLSHWKSPEQRQLDLRYYQFNRSAALILIILLKSLANRLFRRK